MKSPLPRLTRPRRDGWQAAMATSMTLLRERGLDRALNGHTTPILRRGNKAGERQVMRGSVLISMLQRDEAPMFHEERARAAVVAALPKPMSQAEQIESIMTILEQFERQAEEQDADLDDKSASLPVALASPSDAGLQGQVGG